MKALGLLWGYVWVIQLLKRVKTSDENTNFLCVVEAIASLHVLSRVIKVKVYSGYLFLYWKIRLNICYISIFRLSWDYASACRLIWLKR